ILQARTTKIIADSVSVDDSIDLTIIKDVNSDSAIVDDILRARTTKPLSDSVTVDDILQARTTKIIADSVSVDDSIGLTIIKDVNADSATVDDFITTYVTMRIKDS